MGLEELGDLSFVFAFSMMTLKLWLSMTRSLILNT